MKKLYTLIALTLCIFSASAQSILTQDFGRSYEEVKEFLNSKSSFATASFDQPGIIVARTNGFAITYHFNEGVLYKAVTVKNFSDAKEAKTSVETFRTYYQLLQAEQLNLESRSSEERFVAIHGRELHEVSRFAYEKNAIQVTQSAMDLDRCPGNEMKDIIQNETLLAMISR
jgi:hypothetical protein